MRAVNRQPWFPRDGLVETIQNQGLQQRPTNNAQRTTNGDKTTIQRERAKDNTNPGSNHAKRNLNWVPETPGMLKGSGEIAKHDFVAEAVQHNTRHE